MKPTYVLTPAERENRNAKRKEIKQMRITQALVKTERSPSQIRSPKEKFTLEDSIFLHGLRQNFLEHFYKELCIYYDQHRDVLTKSLEAFKEKSPLDAGHLSLCECVSVNIMSKFYRQLGDMMDLSVKDQKALTEVNSELVVDFFTANSFEKTSLRKQLYHQTLTVAKNNPEHPGVDFLHKKMKEMEISEDTYESFDIENYFNLKDKEDQERYRELTKKLGTWASSGESRAHDEIMETLIVLIILFSQEGIAVKNTKKIEKMRTKYTYMLYKYLIDKLKHDQVSSKLCQGMYVRSLALEASSIKRKYFTSQQ
jgi:hypothetical protein